MLAEALVVTVRLQTACHFIAVLQHAGQEGFVVPVSLPTACHLAANLYNIG